MFRLQRYLPFVMWFFPVIFFAYQFILRLWPGLMMQGIMEQLAIDASQFGLLAAFYYYGYAGMQIPVAMLLDRYGARRVILFFALLCSAGTLLFTLTHHWLIACLSRFLIGAGSAVGFLGVSKVISDWFPAAHYARMVGFSFSLGLLGAIYGGKPISLLALHYDWHTLALGLALLAVLLGLAVSLLLRTPPHSTATRTHGFTVKQFKAVLSSPAIWVLALANALMVGSLEGFADVWGIPYLMTAYGIPKSEAALVISFLFVGMLFGGPLLSFASKKWGLYPVISLCGLGMAAVFFMLLSHPSYHKAAFTLLFFITGLLCCYQVLVFASGARLVHPEHLSVTVAFLNCVNMLGGSFFHTLIGKLMETSWTGTLSSDGVHVYSLMSYLLALKVIPVCALLGALLTSMMQWRFYNQSTDSVAPA
ncbi:major facilitator family transporter [Legionella erythra]|uniref:Major facilitator family transporter n=2 Tax=Legionella erythra TaxID=448 RepID=A0A0W0TGM1_LEGER|nr:major facilitator family transporter [Legionella erythra]